MKTKYYKGDVVRTRAGEITIVRFLMGTDFRIQGRFVGEGIDLQVEEVHGGGLVRRADEPEFPAELPPLPDAPADHHFVYRGIGWTAEAARYASAALGLNWEVSSKKERASGYGVHYAELVPNEPYTPPHLRKLAEHLLTLTPEQREAEGFDVKDCATKTECFGDTSEPKFESETLSLPLTDSGPRMPYCRRGPDSVRVTPKTPYLGVSPEVAAELRANKPFPSPMQSQLWERHLGRRLEEDRRYMVLTIDQAVAEFEAGACVFYADVNGFRVLSGGGGTDVYFRLHPVFTKNAKLNVKRQIQSVIDNGLEVWVTDSRKNLALFKQATKTD